MTPPSEPIGGAATPSQEREETLGVSNFSVAQQKNGSRKAGTFSFFSSVPSSAVPLCRPRSRREVKQVQKLFASLQSREEGQTMAEYGVVLAVITIAVFGALTLLSGNIEGAITRVAGYIT
jgi:Flp pilus assembly pilin Flp